MKKKHLFIIIGQFVVILFVLVYAFVQNVKAQESQRAALAAQLVADEQRIEAMKQRDMATAAQAEAERQRMFAEQARIEAEKCRAKR